MKKKTVQKVTLGWFRNYSDLYWRRFSHYSCLDGYWYHYYMLMDTAVHANLPVYIFVKSKKENL